LARFKELRDRCLELRQIATQLQAADKDGGGHLEQFQAAGLDRFAAGKSPTDEVVPELLERATLTARR